ncbi:MAG: hypothetical protein WCO00_11460 [Rhodospirillaceae bacterium]
MNDKEPDILNDPEFRAKRLQGAAKDLFENVLQHRNLSAKQRADAADQRARASDHRAKAAELRVQTQALKVQFGRDD